jgi:extracellular elastinolytic metalloproteinase
MRSFFAASLIIAGLAGQVVGDATHDPNQPTVKRRKTLGFGPFHPHAVFQSTPYQINAKDFRPLDPDSDPYEVAQRFLVDILGDQLSETSTFSLRKDSYTDDNTGVTHVYVRQIINGIEVVDGDININIKDGAVLSFGNSVRSSFAHFTHCIQSHSPFSFTVGPLLLLLGKLPPDLPIPMPTIVSS